MKYSITLAILLTLILSISGLPAEPEVSVARNLATKPLAFTKNQGQWDEGVLFRADAGGATMWFTTDGAYYQFTRKIPGGESRGASPRLSGAAGSDRLGRKPDSVESMMIRASFAGANPKLRMVGEDILEYRSNYFIGNDPTQWRTDVSNYSAILYENVYPGIDLKYYGNGEEMEYDFIVSPGRDPSQIKIQYEGVESLYINGQGELVVETRWGEVIERRPVVYQLLNGTRVPIEGRYEIAADNSFGFGLSGDYDPALPLVIDPVLSYSTYLGGSNNDYGRGIAVDGAGATYVTGETNSGDFPTESWYQATLQGGLDAFVTKLSADGNSLVYSTYLGGSSDDLGYDIAVDGAGAAYLTGYTESTDFPTESWYLETLQGGDDVFVTKLSADGNSLVYSTYLGGSSNDQGYGIAVDGIGAAYLTGHTYSTDFPTESWYQETLLGGLDAFVTKLSTSGSSLVYSTYLGGTGMDLGKDIAVDGAGAAYVTGYTYCTDFPTESAYQETHQGENDVFVTKLSAGGDGLVYSTYLGGSSYDAGYGIAVDGTGSAYLTGRSSSTDFPTESWYQETVHGGDDVFVTKLSVDGNSLVYSTYLGGTSYDCGCAIVANAAGEAYVTGYTGSTDFPTESAYQAACQGGTDSFVTKLSIGGDGLVYSTYLGGTVEDRTQAIAVDATGAAYVAGYTYSGNFPTQNPFQGTNAALGDAFVTKLITIEPGVAGPPEGDLPSAFTLSQNHPNPFNPSTTFEFSLPTRSHVEIHVFDILGQRVKALHEGALAAGTYSITWDGRDESNRLVATGIYLYRIKTDDFVESKKMVLLK